ncbi:MAG: hypothetical protein KBC17_03130 [Candidatus Pacebacteria bacterium]|nr:hypothetical protein [Candidatus Paceibacterota bacterium]
MKKYFFLSFFSLIAIGGVAMFTVAHAQDEYGLRATAEEAGIINRGERQELSTLVGNVLGTALSMVGVLFFGLMIYGGILWMTARGNDDQTKKAFDTITAAVIGLVIILASYAITTFAFRTVGGNSAAGGGLGGTSVGGNNGGGEFGPPAPEFCAAPGVTDGSDCVGKRVGDVCSTPGSSDGVCQGPANSCSCVRNVATPGVVGRCVPKEVRTNVTDCSTVINAQCGQGIFTHCTLSGEPIVCTDKCNVVLQAQCDSTFCNWE